MVAVLLQHLCHPLEVWIIFPYLIVYMAIALGLPNIVKLKNALKPYK